MSDDVVSDGRTTSPCPSGGPYDRNDPLEWVHDEAPPEDGRRPFIPETLFCTVPQGFRRGSTYSEIGSVTFYREE